jgi:hypothetical protein
MVVLVYNTAAQQRTELKQCRLVRLTITFINAFDGLMALQLAKALIKTCYSKLRAKRMNTLMKKTKVESDGWLKIQAPPELENQEVDVIIIPQRPPASERVAAWRRLTEKIGSLPKSEAITEEEIQKEIDDYRAGR